MLVYLVRNKWDGGIYFICATKSLAEEYAKGILTDTNGL